MAFDKDEFLEHHGVKGMKWGVRKDKGHEGERAKTKKIDKLDEKFARNTKSAQTTFAIYNRAAHLTNKFDIDRINNKPKYKDVDFTEDSPLRQAYFKEHQQALITNLKKAASEMGTNASGTKSYSVVETGDGGWDVELTDVKHADTDSDGMHVNVTYDAKGRIVSLEIEEDSLQHYGVKGMKWGKRKAQAPTSDKPKASKPAKKELTPEQKKFRRDLAVRIAAVGVFAAAKKGASWAANNPDKISQFTQRAQNVMNGTKAIGPGYEVFKLTLKNGVYG